MKNKKVLFVAHIDDHINSFHIPFLKMFKEQGYEVDVASCGDFKFNYCDHKYNVPFQRSPLNAKNIAAYFEVKKILNIEKYDIIHCHTPVGGFVTRLANKRSINYEYTKMIYTAHGFHFFKGNSFLKNFIFKSIERWMAKFTDVLVTINEEDYEAGKEFRLKDCGNVEFIKGVGINIDLIQSITGDRNELIKELDISNENILLLSVGEVNINKNQIVVINALSLLPENYHYIICGEGNNIEFLRKRVYELNLERRVHFLGYRNDVYSIMKCCDYFVFPSKREGLPVSVIEAMACGLICVVSNVRGNRDLINNQGGFVLELDEFEKKMPSLLLVDKKKYSNLIEYNYKEISQYDLYEIIKKYKKIYGLR